MTPSCWLYSKQGGNWEEKKLVVLLTAIHGVVIWQIEEHKQNNFAFKELEKRAVQLQSYSANIIHIPCQNPLATMRTKDRFEKPAKVETWEQRWRQRRQNMRNQISVAWTTTLKLNNLQMDSTCLHVQGVEGFSSVCMVLFKSVNNKGKVTEQD